MQRMTWSFRIMVVLLVAVALSAWALPALAHDGAPEDPSGTVDLRNVRFDPHLDTQVPADLTFQDENGQTVRLGDYFGSKPVLLTLNDLTCQNLCPLQLQALVDIMEQVPYRLGNEFQAVTVSIDPLNTAEDAAATKAALTRRYDRNNSPQTQAGWHFLTTSDKGAVDRLAQAVGFDYAYDAVQKDYAHPVGVMLLTPGGKLSRYLYGMDFAPTDLRLGLTEASQNKISGPVEALLLLCYHYSLSTGRYTGSVMTAVRIGGVLTLLALGSFLTVMWRSDLRQSRAAARAGVLVEDVQRDRGARP